MEIQRYILNETEIALAECDEIAGKIQANWPELSKGFAAFAQSFSSLEFPVDDRSGESSECER